MVRTQYTESCFSIRVLRDHLLTTKMQSGDVSVCGQVMWDWCGDMNGIDEVFGDARTLRYLVSLRRRYAVSIIFPSDT